MYDWNEYFKLGNILIAKNTEAEQRTAVSRLYYALYHLSKTYATSHGHRPPKHSQHEALINWYKNNRNAQMSAFGVKLEILKGWRVDADYGYSCFPVNTPKACKRLACDLHSELNKLP